MDKFESVIYYSYIYFNFFTFIVIILEKSRIKFFEIIEFVKHINLNFFLYRKYVKKLYNCEEILSLKQLFKT